MPMKIYILEDNRERREAMRACLAGRFFQYDICFFTTAQAMLDAIQNGLQEVLLISLDHDLEPETTSNGGWPDPGDGRMVADCLASHVPTCPIVIHTTNGPAAVGMEAVLNESDWQTVRVKPYSDLEWIAEAWFPAVRRAIVDSVQPQTRSASQPT